MRAAVSASTRRVVIAVSVACLIASNACGGRPETPSPAPPAQDIESTFFLVGDAGEPDPGGEPVMAALRAELAETSAPAVVVFLGDNIYPAGMPRPGDPQRADSERRLRAQIEAVLEGGGEAVFALGNHDWNYAGTDNRGRVLEQERYGLGIGMGRVTFAPGSGCPGPWVRDIGERSRLIVLDTQWWLLDEARLGVAVAGCTPRSDEAILDSLRSALRSAGDRQVIVAGHHPLRSSGPHGGHFSFRQHVFPLTEIASWLWLPLPLIGSAYPVARMLGISDQDLSSGRYSRMREQLGSAFATAPPLVYASGHDHSLQLMEGAGARYQVVSGAGNHGHTSPVGNRSGTIFTASGAAGYVRMEIQRDGRARLTFVVVDGEGGRTEPFSVFLQ